jgi:pantoate--beta-alanine ligase
MHIISTIAEMQHIATAARREGRSIGCVPTMGSLHAGHGSLISESSHHHPLTIVSVFVNPTQFGPNEDFEKYPRSLDADVELIRSHGGTHVFAPTVQEMYPHGFSTSIHVKGITEILEGAHRPGHFDGVATVVCKLFQAMLPDEAYFGQKDLQQTIVVQRMTHDLGLPVKVTVLPTKREDDGLAMSSRNVYLSQTERDHATTIYKSLVAGARAISLGETSGAEVERIMHHVLATPGVFSVDYAVACSGADLAPCITIHPGEQIALLIAARLGSTRLIDNMLVTA